jgi:gamma-glutamyl-gamma-aminobutyrate hydrolase PuuD/uncharacterized protein YjbI with pentapeptide repeats
MHRRSLSLPPRTAAPSTSSAPHTPHDPPPAPPGPGEQRFHDLLNEVGPLRQTSSTGAIDLRAFLAERQHPPTINGVKLSGDSPSLRELHLCDLHFNDCKFEWNHFSGTQLVNCQFVKCDFENASFMNANLSDCTFQKCKMHEVMLINADLHKVEFTDCHISRGSFEDSRIIGCSFIRTPMPATHFLSAVISDSKIIESDLKDTAFLRKAESEGKPKGKFDIDSASENTCGMTQPTTATLVFPEQRGHSVPRVGMKIDGVARTIPLRIAMQTPAARADDVDREVTCFLEGRQQDTTNPRPLAQLLVSEILEKPENFPSSWPIVEKARVLARHIDSVVLPGGEDISPHLYGGTPEPETDWKGDYRRSLLELGLIHECFNKGIPLMAICRGFQMTSIYFGAQLHQHVGHQVGVRVLDKEEPRKPERGLFGNALDKIRTAVYHHQAVPAGVAMAHLRPTLTRTLSAPPQTRWEAVMAVESSAQMAPLIGVQFHPEFFERDSARAHAVSITNEELDRLASSHVDPETNIPGLTNPSHMIASGILDYMSAGNDDLWEILAQAAEARRRKARIGPDALTGGRRISSRRRESIHPT